MLTSCRRSLRPVVGKCRLAISALSCLGVARAMSTCATPAEFQAFAAFPEGLPQGFQPFRLMESWDISLDTKVLRYSLPGGLQNLAELNAASGVKVRREIDGHLLDKSYSPISLPATEEYVDLLVKRYPPRPGGGLGAFLCDMRPGDEVEMKLKAPRNLGAIPYAPNRFADVALIGAGTGVAPLLHLARVIMADPSDRTRIWFVVAHRTEQDVLMKDELEAWAQQYPDRFRLHVALSQPIDGLAWQSADMIGYGRSIGRLDLPTVRRSIPEVGDNVLAMVCGTDGFLETVCGDKVRIQVPGQTKAKKVPGPVTGFLGQLGFNTSGVVVKL